MRTNQKGLLGSAIAGALGVALLCSAGAARAQDYYDNGYYYDNGRETVIVSPPAREFDTPRTHNLLGHLDGQVNPTVVSMSHPVSFADLDLTRQSDFNELRARVADTACGLCARLNDGFPDVIETTESRECIRDAIHNAMAQVPITPIG